MIWISTLCLLFVAAWLFFNAVNERRWVQAHSHDENVASDEGFLPSFTARTPTGSLGPDGKMSIHQENSGFSRAVMKVQATTSKYGDKFFESKVAASRSGDDNFFGRAVAHFGGKAERMDQKLDDKMKAASSGSEQGSSAHIENEDVVTRTSRKVANKAEEVRHMVTDRAKKVSQGFADRRAVDEGLFDKVVNKLSGTVEKMESGTPQTAKIRKAVSEHKDIVSRMASKVGDKVNSLDDKFVDVSKKVADKLNKD